MTLAGKRTQSEWRSPRKVAPIEGIEADAGWPINLPGWPRRADRARRAGTDPARAQHSPAGARGTVVQFYSSQYVLARAEASDGKKGPVPRTQ